MKTWRIRRGRGGLGALLKPGKSLEERQAEAEEKLERYERSMRASEAVWPKDLPRSEVRKRRRQIAEEADLIGGLIRLAPTEVYRVVCPPVYTAWGRQLRREKPIGVAYIMPQRRSGNGPVTACIDVYRGGYPSPGCREFPNRAVARAWLKVKTEDLECS